MCVYTAKCECRLHCCLFFFFFYLHSSLKQMEWSGEEKWQLFMSCRSNKHWLEETGSSGENSISLAGDLVGLTHLHRLLCVFVISVLLCFYIWSRWSRREKNHLSAVVFHDRKTQFEGNWYLVITVYFFVVCVRPVMKDGKNNPSCLLLRSFYFRLPSGKECMHLPVVKTLAFHSYRFVLVLVRCDEIYRVGRSWESYSVLWNINISVKIIVMKRGSRVNSQIGDKTSAVVSNGNYCGQAGLN